VGTITARINFGADLNLKIKKILLHPGKDATVRSTAVCLYGTLTPSHFRLDTKVPNFKPNTALDGRDRQRTTSIYSKQRNYARARRNSQTKENERKWEFKPISIVQFNFNPSSSASVNSTGPPFNSTPSLTSPVENPPKSEPLSPGPRLKCAGSAPPHATDEPRRVGRRGR
jgi:hypothetical protein